MSDNNPLVSLSQGSALPFHRIRAEHVEPGLGRLIAEARAGLDRVAAAEGAPTFAEVYLALEAATEPLEMAYSVVSHLESVRTTPELRSAYNKMKPEVSGFFASIPLDERLYHRLRALADSDEGRSLPPDASRALSRTLDDFRRHGAALGAKEKVELEALSRELAGATARFGQNVLDATSAWSKPVDADRLAGLPDSARAAARAAAEARGQKGYLLTLHAPSLVPALTYLDDRDLREELYRAYYGRAASGALDNGPLVKEVLRLRARQARLLGYESFPEFVLEPRMARTAERARSFVSDLEERTRPAFQREMAELEGFRKEREGENAPKVEPWDLAYYAEKLRRERFDFDEEALRPYFEVGRVMNGLFTVAERLYGIAIEEDQDLPGWHPEVRAFSVREGGDLLGQFYVDLHPREDKRGGAWMHGLASGVVAPDGRLDRPHLGLFAANLTPPIGGPSLLSHDEVQTLFHEFGHLLHHLLSRVRIRGQAGTRVAWDFVELPSQIMENWCWSREALDLFARHHETEAPIPEPLFEKMLRARSFRAATAMMRQLGFAELDLALHLDFDPSGEEDPVAFARRVMARFSPAPLYEGWAFVNGFSHLFASATGYAAGYYSYKWAEVLDADAFTRFEEAGVFDPEVGAAFRRTVLERGDAEDPDVLFAEFMGRPPRLEPLLRRSGL